MYLKIPLQIPILVQTYVRKILHISCQIHLEKTSLSQNDISCPIFIALAKDDVIPLECVPEKPKLKPYSVYSDEEILDDYSYQFYAKNFYSLSYFLQASDRIHEERDKVFVKTENQENHDVFHVLIFSFLLTITYYWFYLLLRLSFLFLLYYLFSQVQSPLETYLTHQSSLLAMLYRFFVRFPVRNQYTKFYFYQTSPQSVLSLAREVHVHVAILYR